MSYETFNQFFTMHGTIMLLLFATPLFVGFANAIMPLQIGAPDVAFPRLNMFSYWLFLFGGLIAVCGFLTPGGAAELRLVRVRAAERRGQLTGRRRRPVDHGPVRWPASAPSSARSTSSPRSSACARPGMTMFRMPIFTWNILVTVDAGADRLPDARRRAAGAGGRPDARRPRVRRRPTAGRSCGSTCSGSSGHPEVYIIALPFFGIITEVLPVFSRKPIFGYIGLVVRHAG